MVQWYNLNPVGTAVGNTGQPSMFVGQKKFESYFSDRLTFSNICGVTSHRIYRLALPLLSPEMLFFSLSKCEISI